MIRNFLLLSLSILLISSCCCGKQGNEQKCEQKSCCTASQFGKIDSAISLTVEILPQPAYPKGSPVDKWGKLKVAENENGVRSLCDENGKPVQLRGFSSHGLQWSGVANLTEANVKAMRELLKCNVFRIALYIDEEGGYAYNPTLRSRTQVLGEDDWGQVENVVRWCGESGIYCLIDWHVHDPGNPQHWRYRNRKYPEKVEGIDLAADFFTYCARRFQNQKHVLFEICNEPNPVENYQFKEEITWLDHIKPYCEDMLKIIRSYDENVVVICGTPNWSSKIEDVVGNEPQDANGEKYKNIMYTFHFYAATHNEERMEAFQKTSPLLPLFATEWGTTDASGWANFRPDLSSRWLEILSGDNDGKQIISWANWSFSAEGGLSGALKWNSGNIASDFPQILSESGKFIYEQLKKAKD